MSEDVKTEAPSSIDELKTAMALKGTVKRLELYGAFVDIGLKQDGLLHISQLGKPNVRNVEDVVKPGDQVTVYVLKVDSAAGRVALSLVEPPAVNVEDIKEGDIIKGKVVRIEPYGVFVDIGAERAGMVHVSELADGYVKSPSDLVKIGQEVDVRVIKVSRKKKQMQIDLSMKQPQERIEIVAPEEDEEESPTAMAMALRKAMRSDRDNASNDDAYQDEYQEMLRMSRGRNNKKDKRRNRNQQDDIIQRTLRNHSSN